MWHHLKIVFLDGSLHHSDVSCRLESLVARGALFALAHNPRMLERLCHRGALRLVHQKKSFLQVLQILCKILGVPSLDESRIDLLGVHQLRVRPVKLKENIIIVNGSFSKAN